MTLTADWLRAPGPRAVMAALAAGGHQAWFVGGCVRNALLGQGDSDIDIATTARPDDTIAAAKAAGLHPVPTGADHGTITVVAAGTGYEVTTLRRDVETDGRHAVVHFSDRIEDDAARRDFTMNALYATADGTVLDPLNGLPDLRAGHVRFIGDARARITEDYLRILRFFRFTAWYGHPEEGPDADGLAACADLAEGLSRIAAERVGQEMRKLLAAPNPAPVMGTMALSGVLARILPGAVVDPLAPLIALEQQLDAAPDPVRRLAVLGGTDVTARLRLTRAESRQLGGLRDGMASADPLPLIAHRDGGQTALDVALLRAASMGMPVSSGLRADLDRAAAAQFPVSAADLMPEHHGAALGQRLQHLRGAWVASGFAMTRAELLALPPEISP